MFQRPLSRIAFLNKAMYSAKPPCIGGTNRVDLKIEEATFTCTLYYMTLLTGFNGSHRRTGQTAAYKAHKLWPRICCTCTETTSSIPFDHFGNRHVQKIEMPKNHIDCTLFLPQPYAGKSNIFITHTYMHMLVCSYMWIHEQTPSATLVSRTRPHSQHLLNECNESTA